MYGLVIFALTASVILALVLATRNANRLFVASVQNGRFVSIRGHMPKRLHRDLEDVLRLRPVSKAMVRVVVQSKRPALEAKGDIRENEIQRLRNVVGTWDVAKIRSAPYRTD